MKFLVLLVFVSTANLALCTKGKYAEVEFPPSVLRPDLEELRQYFNATNNDVDAFIHWPNDITFLAHHDSKTGLIKIEGTFNVTSARTAHEGLYYKDGTFYVMRKSMKVIIPEDMPVYHAPLTLPERQEYASIKYFGLDEIKHMIEPFHSKYTFKYDSEVQPAAFLAVAENSEHFIEYTLWNENWSSRPVDGRLRVLLGSEATPKQMALLRSVEAHSLVFNKTSGNVSVSTEANKFAPQGPEQLRNVFGVRIARVGVVADVNYLTVNWFNSGDWSGKPKHTIRAIDFLRKVKNVEPRYKSGVEVGDAARPRYTYFHVMGHVLVKRVNTLNGKIDNDCPLVIQYKTRGLQFLIGAQKLDQLCTDDSKLWKKTEDAKTVYEPREVITLTHPYNVY